MSDEDEPLHLPEQWREIGQRAFPRRSQEVMHWISQQPRSWLAALTRRRIEGGRDAPLTADELLVETFLDLLERLRIGVLVMDYELRVYFANQALRGLIAQTPGLALEEQRLRILDSAGKASLLSEIGRITGRERRTGHVGAALHLDAAGRLLLYLMPAIAAPAGVREGPLVCLFAAQRDAPAPARAQDIAVWFDLTGAEAELAAAFVHGESLKHYAERRGSSISTVRNQFAALRGKLGAHDQADVVRKVPLGSPPTPFLVDKP